MAKKPAKKSKNAKRGSSSQRSHAVQPHMPLAILYNLDAGTDRGDAVRAVLADQDIHVRTATAHDLSSPVGALAGLVGFKRSSKPYADTIPACEFMLLHNIGSRALDKLLDALRAADVSVACKAQVTQYNRLWPLGTLITEVEKEHQAMTSAHSVQADSAQEDSARG